MKYSIQKIKTIKFLTFGTFFHTFFLIGIFLALQNTFLRADIKHQTILKELEKEKLRTANITLETAKYQSHQKILNLQQKYLEDRKYIKYGDTIKEKDLETFIITNENDSLQN